MLAIERDKSAADEAPCAGFPATPLAGAVQGTDIGRVAGAVNKLGGVSKFGAKKEQLERSSSAGLCQFEK